MKAPPPNPPRCQFLELPDVLRVVEGAPPLFRALFALAYGAGIELGAILTLVESDVDPNRREVRARGSKAWTRDRIARVADWAWPIRGGPLALLRCPESGCSAASASMKLGNGIASA